MTDYSDHPQSIAEAKANRDQNGSAWSPRDVLIYMLREIDSGRIAPAAVALIYSEQTSPTDTRTRYVQSSPNAPFLLGMIELAKARILKEI